MPKGVYERTPEQKARIAAQAAVGNEAAMKVLRGRPRTEEQKAHHSAVMRGKPAWNKGVPSSPETIAKIVTHGHASNGKLTPTYLSWRSMKQRCNDPGKDNYPYYGGRGIKVCPRWLDFVNFLADMGERPEGTELNRINNDGNYELGNVVWGPKSDNVVDRNERNSRAYGQTAEERAGQLRAYKSWSAMRDRCNNRNVSNYHRYGGRGITICVRWETFDVFFADMGPRPVGTVLGSVGHEFEL